MKGKYERLGHRHGRWVIASFFILILSGVLWIGLSRRSSPTRSTVAIAGDPVVVWSLDTKTNRSIIVEIPAGTLVEALHGYGTYSLASLWKLGEIERKDKNVLSDTLSDVLGIPIPWYIGPKEGAPSSSTGVSQIFSLKTFIKLASHHYETNMDLFSFLRLSLIAMRMKPSDVSTISLSTNNVLIKGELPDGSVAEKVDTDQLDHAIGQFFEDPKVRREALSVAIYNTTTVQALGGRVGRTLGHLGVRVNFIGNSPSLVTSLCEVVGSTEALNSYTARFIEDTMGCLVSKNKSIGDARADITVFIGNGFASRYKARSD